VASPRAKHVLPIMAVVSLFTSTKFACFFCYLRADSTKIFPDPLGNLPNTEISTGTEFSPVGIEI